MKLKLTLTSLLLMILLFSPLKTALATTLISPVTNDEVLNGEIDYALSSIEITGTYTVRNGGILVIGEELAGDAPAEVKVTVTSTGALTVEPGGKIHFRNGNAKIINNGTLVIGSADSLEAAELLPIGTDQTWGGVLNTKILKIYNSRLTKSGSNAIIQQSGTSEIKKSVFQDCATAILASGGSLKILQNNFENNGSAVILTGVNDSFISGNKFHNNSIGVHLSKANTVEIRANDFQNLETDTTNISIKFESDAINDGVKISYNNFIHNRNDDLFNDGTPDNEVYLVQNESTSPVTAYNCYWKNNGEMAETVAKISNAQLAGPVPEIVVAKEPRDTPVPTDADITGPVVVLTSPTYSRPGEIELTVIITDNDGWGIDPGLIQLRLINNNSNYLQGVSFSYDYTNRQYQFKATITLNDLGTYIWQFYGTDIAGNSIENPGFSLTVTNTQGVSPPTTWKDFEPGKFYLITVPIKPTQTDHQGVLGLLDLYSQIIRYQSGAYVVNDDPALEQFDLGKGFWLKLGENDVGVTVTWISGSVPINPDYYHQSYIHHTQLEPGWNMIGNPFLEELDLTNITFSYTKDGNEKENVSLIQAVKDGVMGYGLWDYDNSKSSYHYETQSLEPWRGYWIKANQACTINYHRDENTIPVGAASLSNWNVQLTVSQNQQKDGANNFGLISTAAAGVDQFDAQKPPSQGTTGLSSYFLPQGSGTAYGVDFRSMGSSAETWEYVVTGLTPGEARLNWTGVINVPSQYQLLLKDSLTGTTVDLRRTTGYTYTVNSETIRKFEIILSKQGASNIKISNFKYSRNPFNPLRESLTVSYDLSTDATIEIRIYDWVGNLVCVQPKQKVNAGTGVQFNWNGRNNLGRVVANGVYLCKIIARNGAAEASEILKLAVIK